MQVMCSDISYLKFSFHLFHMNINFILIFATIIVLFGICDLQANVACMLLSDASRYKFCWMQDFYFS